VGEGIHCKLFQECGGIKDNGGGGEFKYDLFEILEELLEMLQCTGVSVSEFLILPGYLLMR
jgi:hypothetical protein